MTSIAQKTIGQLIDELVTTNVKVYHLIDAEIEAQEANDYEEAGRLGEKVIKLNKSRNQLIAAIDEYFGQSDAQQVKLYGKLS